MFKKHYIISSKVYTTIRDAKKQIEEWKVEGCLDSKAKVFEIEDYNMAIIKPVKKIDLIWSRGS